MSPKRGFDSRRTERRGLALELDLRRALANREITIAYRPEFYLNTNSIVRFEDLAPESSAAGEYSAAAAHLGGPSRRG
jgi:sensor c-di-GMP phosphodiesterase-like protein